MGVNIHTAFAPYDVDAPAQTVSIEVNSDLLRRANEIGMDLSKTMESALSDAIVRQTRQTFERRYHERRSSVRSFNPHAELAEVVANRVRNT